jgi:hypothetical protein
MLCSLAQSSCSGTCVRLTLFPAMLKLFMCVCCCFVVIPLAAVKNDPSVSPACLKREGTCVATTFVASPARRIGCAKHVPNIATAATPWNRSCLTTCPLTDVATAHVPSNAPRVANEVCVMLRRLPACACVGLRYNAFANTHGISALYVHARL